MFPASPIYVLDKRTLPCSPYKLAYKSKLISLSLDIDVYKSKLAYKEFKLWSMLSFFENISYLLLCRNVFCIEYFILNLLYDEVPINLHVFRL